MDTRILEQVPPGTTLTIASLETGEWSADLLVPGQTDDDWYSRTFVADTPEDLVEQAQQQITAVLKGQVEFVDRPYIPI